MADELMLECNTGKNGFFRQCRKVTVPLKVNSACCAVMRRFKLRGYRPDEFHPE